MIGTKGAQMVPKKVGRRGTQMDSTKGAQMAPKKVGMFLHNHNGFETRSVIYHPNPKGTPPPNFAASCIRCYQVQKNINIFGFGG
eukprot:scaffold464_cov66-Cyclotella_meneghiniana.AAC.4